MKAILRAAIIAAASSLLLPLGAEAATSFVSPVQTYTAISHQWLTGLGSNGQFVGAQPAVGDLVSVAGGTLLGNPTGSAAAPSATAAPVLGVPATTAGTLGLADGGAGGATVTLQNPSATTAYNFNLPATAGSSGQVLTSGGGGAAAMTWSTLATAKFTVATKTAAYSVLAADDGTRFDNSGAAGAITLTLPASPSAGDNWCFEIATAQSLEVLANTGETITLGNTTGASAGNLTANTVGSSVCIYFQSATAAYVWASNGSWSLT